MLTTGANFVRSEFPEEYFLLIDDWLASGDKASGILGLRAMPALVSNPEFENLPALFRMLGPLLRESSSALENDLTQVVRSLGRRSPQEAAFFLQQNLKAPHKSGLAIIIRRSLDVFSSDLQESLRKLLRERQRESHGV